MNRSIRIRRSTVEQAIRKWAPDQEMLQALGLVPYWGKDRTHATGRRINDAVVVLREPEFIGDDEDEGWVDDGLKRGFHHVS